MRIFDVTWDRLKQFVSDKDSIVQFIEADDRYHVLAFDQYYGVQADVMKGTLHSDEFETDFKPSANKKLSPARNTYGELIVIAEKGNDSFDTIITHDWTKPGTWPSPDNSVWEIGPSSPTKFLSIAKAELQFTHDVKVASSVPPNEFYFDVWVGNPVFNPMAAPTSDDAAYIPGHSAGNPIRFLYKRYTYKSITDVFSFGNEHFSMYTAVDGLPAGITTIQFNYDQRLELRGDQYAVLRFSTKDNRPLEGTFLTVSLIVSEFDI